MAQQSVKRRKLGHVESDNDSEASFASFSSDNEALEESSEGVAGDSYDQEDGHEQASEVDDSGPDEDGSESEDGSASRKGHHTKAPSLRKDRRPNPKANPQPGMSAYTSGTFKSHFFKLQVDELLGQIRPKHGKREEAAEAALRTLKKSIEALPARGPFSVAQAERELISHKVTVPFPDPRPDQDAKYKFAYAPPASINVVGSFALKTSSASNEVLEADMVVTMPKHLFEEKDYLNYRYFYKRASYLAFLASGLKNAHQGTFRLQFKLFNGDPLKPVLVVSPIDPNSSQKGVSSLPAWRINIIPCTTPDQFFADKIRPDKNCLRKLGTSHQTDTDDAKPTSYYNSSLRSDSLLTSYLQLLHRAKKTCESFVDACLLGSTWLRQRGLSRSLPHGGFGNFEWNTLVALCLEGGASGGRPLLSENYSSYQLFKATLQLIAVKDAATVPVVFGGLANTSVLPGDGFPVYWDAARNHNLLFKMSPWSYKSLRHEARLSLQALGDQPYDSFDATFILSARDPSHRFDNIVRLSESVLKYPTATQDHAPHDNLVELYNGLKRSLGDRATHISIASSELDTWNLGSSRPRRNQGNDLSIGLVLNPETFRRTIDQGPSAENKEEAAAFRQFWGEKAELRRFKDGSILESLVWLAPQQGGPVPEQIIRFYLNRHFAVATIEDVQFLGGEFEKFIRGGPEIVSYSALQSQYKQLESDIRGMQDLPLAIRQISPADPQLRYTSSQLPVQGASTREKAPACVTIQFEGTSRWPDDLVAIQRTKIAFLLQVSQLSAEDVTTRLGLENEDQDVLNQGFLDVAYPSGGAFRLRIHHDREQTLLERQLKDKASSPKTREVAAIGLAKYKRDFVKNPAHTQAIARLCIRHPAMSGCIRLTKRWFASHLLSNHIAEEVIELLVARTFTQPWPWQTPSSVKTGFLRTLSWIARWDWRVEPLIVDLSGAGEVKQADVQAITTTFDAWRKLDPSLNRVALFTASNVDRDGTTWTDGQPAKVVAGRMTALAKAACAQVSEKQLDLDPASLFSSPLHDFDFVLHLDGAKVGGRSKGAQNGNQFKNLTLAEIESGDSLGFDPVGAFLHELQTVYGSAVLLFHGGDERNVIAGLWSPQTARRSWKVNLAFSTIPTVAANEEETHATLNKTATISEMVRLGGDLIERVEVFRH